MKNKKIVYTPIDIEFDMPSENALIEWFENNKVLDTDYWEYTENRHTWCFIAMRHMPSDWRRFNAWREWFNERVASNSTDLFFAPGFEELFPSLANAIRQLPFKEIGASGMLMQMGAVPPHRDTYDPDQPQEPRRYIIYITNPSDSTFYIQHGDVKIYPQIDEKYRCFAFNNTDVLHGADPTFKTKIILSTAGIIDQKKHNELLSRSIKKFSNKVIYIDDI